MKILITGGAGFIGSNLALKLIAQGHTLSVLDNLSPQIHGVDPLATSELFRSIDGKVRFVRGTVENRNDWREALAGIEAVVHLAAETGTGQSMYEIKRYIDVNVGGTALLLDILANESHSVEKVVVASSRSIYGEGKYISPSSGAAVYPAARNEEQLAKGIFDHIDEKSGEKLVMTATDEESKIHPSSVYGITKQNQEQMVMTVCGALGIGASALRYQNVYGPGQSLSNPYTGILSIFSTRIKNGSSIDVFEDGLETRDFVYIDDVTEATSLALFSSAANGQVFGIGSGIATPVIDVANLLVKSYNSDSKIRVTGAYRVGDIRHNYADLSKAKALLGFEPKYSFSSGLSNFVAWVEKQAVNADGYEASILEMKNRGLFKEAGDANLK